LIQVPQYESRHNVKGVITVRKIALFVAVAMVASLAMPALAQAPAPKPGAMAAKIKDVNTRLEKAFHDLRAAAELVNKARPGGQLEATVDQALQSMAEAERRVDLALSIVRQMKPGSAASARPQIEEVEKLVSQALTLIRDAEGKIDAAYKARPKDAKKIGLMLKQADRHTDASIRMLRQLLASK
jgi:hypothetical protein